MGLELESRGQARLPPSRKHVSQDEENQMLKGEET